jgi:hypothetical protein
LVQSTNGSIIEFARRSKEFRAFDDPLFKLTMVNLILHLGSGIARFLDDPLPGIDYHLLKQLLRQGILRPRADLAAKLTSGQFLHREEGMDLRRMALCALVEISNRTGLSGELLDNRWWLNRVKCADDHPVCLDPATEAECPFNLVCARLTDLRFPLEETRYY